MPETSSPPPEESGQNLIAPLWHTVVVVLILLGFSALGARSHSAFGVGGHGRVAGYLTAAVFEWLVVALIWFGLRLRRNSVGKLLGQTWLSWKRLFQDLGLAAAFLVVSNIILAALAVALKAKPSQALRSFTQGAGGNCCIPASLPDCRDLRGNHLPRLFAASANALVQERRGGSYHAGNPVRLRSRIPGIEVHGNDLRLRLFIRRDGLLET